MAGLGIQTAVSLRSMAMGQFLAVIREAQVSAVRSSRGRDPGHGILRTSERVRHSRTTRDNCAGLNACTIASSHEQR